MINRNSALYIRSVLKTCCILISILSVLDAYHSSPNLSRLRHKSRLSLVDPETGHAVVNNMIPYLLSIDLPPIPQIDLSILGKSNPLTSLFSSGESSLGWFSVVDAAKFPFLPNEAKDFLLTFPVIVRMSLGFFTLDVIPTVIDILILKNLQSLLIGPKRPYEEINIDELPKLYDVEKIKAFYKKIPRVVISRASEILAAAKDFLFGLLSDYAKGTLKTNQPVRAVEFTKLITTLGPTFIKVGQALSIRPDLISPEYQVELVKLQEQVPPFSSEEALKILEKELKGLKLKDVFESLDAFERPMAAASLGQVYKARLRQKGTSVAVKIQRPHMLLSITLDLYIVRAMLVFGQAFPVIAEECKGLILVVDNWAGRFQEELDYVQEMDNSEKFQQQMDDLKNTMGETVVVPQVFRELSSEKVLVSEWIDGTKLSKIDTSTERGKETVRTLSRVLLNSYLAQLLETGFLHGDPHPGNFLVTSEGKLCILDYGLMTTVDEDKRFALLEFVSNLLAKNYDATLDGLVILGFVPDEVVNDSEKRRVVAPLLASVFKKISNGGGAFAINIGAIGKEMESLSKEYPLVIPPYFGLILRSFGALEGLGLSVDKDYSIVKECLPYLSSRLLSDDSERVRATLRTFLYGAGGRLDIDRVDHLAEGYRSFSATSAAAASGKAFEDLRFTPLDARQNPTSSLASIPFANGKITPSEVDPTLSSAARILFSKEGNYVQELILDESVRIADALSRSVLSTAFAAATQQPLVLGSLLLRNAIVGGGASLLPSRFQNAGLRIQSISPYFPFGSAAEEIEGVLSLNQEDIETLRTLKRMLQLMTGTEAEIETVIEADSADKSTGIERRQGKEREKGKAKGRVNHSSSGLIGADDLALVQLLMTQLSSSMQPLKPSSIALSFTRQTGSAANLRSQVSKLMPLLRDNAPGARLLALKFGRKLAGKSAERLAKRRETSDQRKMNQKLQENSQTIR